jgi:putative membrane protein
MRIIRLLFLLAVSIVLIVLALANRQIVSLQLLPNELADFVGLTGALPMPLFLVILLGVLIGLLLGFVWEYLREYKHRKALGLRTKEVQSLEREVKKLKQETTSETDQILALLD